MAYRKNRARTRSYRLSLERRKRSRASHSRCKSSRSASRQKASSERLRTAGSPAVTMPVNWLMARLSPDRRHLTHGQQLDQLGQDFVAIAAAQRQGHLRMQETVAQTDVVAVVGALERQVLLAFGQLGKGRRKAHARSQKIHDARREHVHSEEAKVV